METLRNEQMDEMRGNTAPASAVGGHHTSEGTMGEVAGTGAGAISGGVIGAAVGGPVGAVIGAVAGGVLGAKGGEVAHEIGDDHDDVNLSTDSEGALGRDAGAGAGAISGAVIGTAAGPVGSVVGAVAGGMLGAAAGDAAKHMGENDINRENAGVVAAPVASSSVGATPVVINTPTPVIVSQQPGAMPAQMPAHGHTSVLSGDTPGADLSPGNEVPGVQTGGRALDGTPDTRGIMEKTADAVTGDRLDDKTGKVV